MIVLGSHFIFTQDRDHQLPKPSDHEFTKFNKKINDQSSPSLHWLFSHYQSCSSCLNHLKSCCSGGGGGFIDYLSNCAIDSRCVGCGILSPNHFYHLAQQYVDVEGSYGQIIEENNEVKFRIIESTFPWLVGTTLFNPFDEINILFNAENVLTHFSWDISPSKPSSNSPLYRRSYYAHHSDRWEIVHNTFTKEKLQNLFNHRVQHARL